MADTFSRRSFLFQGGRVLLAGGAVATAGPLLEACDWFAKSSPTSTAEVTYTYPTFTPVPDVQLVQDAINKILLPKYGVTLKLNPVDAGAYDQKQKLAVAAGDVQDIVYSVPWINNYYVIVDGVSTDAGIIGVKADDPNLKVVNIATLPEFRQQVQLARQWYRAGYYPAEPPGDQSIANWRAGKYAVEIDVVHRDSVGQLKQTYGMDFVAKGLGPLVLTTGGIIATMNNVSNTSKHPEAATKVLEALNTDVEVYRLISRGIEGKHYVVTDAKNGVVGFPTGVTASNNR